MANKEMKTLQFPNNPNVYEVVDAQARENLTNKQDKLVSGVNIATINNQNITKGGNIIIEGSGSGATPEQIQQIETNKNDISSLKTNKQDTLIAGEGIEIKDNTISTFDPYNVITGNTQDVVGSWDVATGELKEFANACYSTQLIKIGKQDTLRYEDLITEGFYSVAYFDGTKKLLPDISIKGTRDLKEKEVLIPTEAKYFSISTYGNQNSPWALFFSGNEKPVETHNPINYLEVFQYIGVVGDSLSVGFTQDVEPDSWAVRNIEYSWPRMLGRRCGNTILNFGISGMTTKKWIADSKCGVEAKKPENKCQLYLYNLGANDGYTQSDVGTMSDINFSNISLSADTVYGNTAKNIKFLHDINPDSIIILLPVYPPRDTGRVLNNKALKEIAANTIMKNTYHVHYVDLLEGDIGKLFRTAEFNKEQIVGHFTPTGYLYISNYIQEAINRYLSKNTDILIPVAHIAHGTNTIVN